MTGGDAIKASPLLGCYLMLWVLFHKKLPVRKRNGQVSTIRHNPLVASLAHGQSSVGVGGGNSSLVTSL